MTSQAGHKELIEELGKHRTEVNQLKESLNELDKEKESWFTKKSEASNKIKESIAKIKELKAKRDLFTSEVRNLKAKRDTFNEEVKQESSELNDLKKGQEEISKEFSKNLKSNEPSFRIRKELEQLEFKMETEPMSFDKEQALMKKIKQLRSKVEATKVLNVVNKKVRETSTDLRTTRKEANDIHRQIQEKARESQQMHEQILVVSKEIDVLKVQEKEAFDKFIEYKQKFTELNNQFKGKLGDINSVRGELGKISDEKKDRRRKDQENFLKTKEQEVNEKIKKGEKLTTEDLLVFQNMKE